MAKTDSAEPNQSGNARFYRAAGAALLILLVGSYIAGVISGTIRDERQIDAVTLGIIGIAVTVVVALVSPASFRRLQLLQLGELKLELREVRATQDSQAERLHEIGLVLSILLPENERAHLLHLADGTTHRYRGGNAMRTELRRLRSMGLISMQRAHSVGAMRTNMEFDLAEYVRLTKRGLDCVAKIKEVDKADRPDEERP